MHYLEDTDSASLCVVPLGPYSQVCSRSINQGESSPQAVELDCAAVICSPGAVMEVAKWLRNIPITLSYPYFSVVNDLFGLVILLLLCSTSRSYEHGGLDHLPRI